MKPLTIEGVKALHASAEFQAAAAELLVSMANARAEKARVDAYIQPIFDSYGFVDPHDGSKIVDHEHSYVCHDEAVKRGYYDACDAEHRKHGFMGADGHCPALRASMRQRDAEVVILKLLAPVLGLTFDQINCSYDGRKTALNMLLQMATMRTL